MVTCENSCQTWMSTLYVCDLYPAGYCSALCEAFCDSHPIDIVMPAPPKQTPITVSELRKHDGSNPSLPIYVAVKGVIFNVTGNSAYGKGGSYNCFAGKDASRALGKSTLKPEDCVADYSGLTEHELETLDEWYAFFSKKYDIVGRVVPDP